jgi:hypothetical protein
MAFVASQEGGIIYAQEKPNTIALAEQEAG